MSTRSDPILDHQDGKIFEDRTVTDGAGLAQEPTQISMTSAAPRPSFRGSISINADFLQVHGLEKEQVPSSQKIIHRTIACDISNVHAACRKHISDVSKYTLLLLHGVPLESTDDCQIQLSRNPHLVTNDTLLGPKLSHHLWRRHPGDPVSGIHHRAKVSALLIQTHRVRLQLVRRLHRPRSASLASPNTRHSRNRI